MKVKDVRLQIVQVDVAGGSLAVDQGTFGGATEIGVLRIITEDGVEGNCFVGTFNHGGKPLFEPIATVLKSEIVGHDIAERERLWARLGHLIFRRRIPLAAWAAVDIALWDAQGKAAGVPVHQLLGTCRDKILAYASSSYHPRVEEYVEEALHFKSLGYKAYKFHPGGSPVEMVKETARKVREAVGPEMKLMIDCSLMYTYREALDLGQVLDETNFHWFEDPIRYVDIEGLVELARRVRTPLAVTDYPDFAFYEIAPYIQRGAARVIRGDARKLGVTGMKKAAALCEGFGLNYEIHQGGNSLLNAANLAVELSIPNTDFYECLLPAEANQFGVENDIAVDSEGYVHAPTEPGLGCRLDWKFLEKRTVRTI